MHATMHLDPGVIKYGVAEIPYALGYEQLLVRQQQAPDAAEVFRKQARFCDRAYAERNVGAGQPFRQLL